MILGVYCLVVGMSSVAFSYWMAYRRLPGFLTAVVSITGLVLVAGGVKEIRSNRPNQEEKIERIVMGLDLMIEHPGARTQENLRLMRDILEPGYQKQDH